MASARAGLPAREPLTRAECDALRLLVGEGYQRRLLAWVLDVDTGTVTTHANGECTHANEVRPAQEAEHG